MSIPAPARAGLPTISVTVFDSATVFDGLNPSDVVYRYDLPGAGIAEGWATAAVVDQVRQLSAEHWPDIDVDIDASPDIADSLQLILANKGVRSRGVGEEPGPDDVDGGAEAPGGAAREQTGGRHRLIGRPLSERLRAPFHSLGAGGGAARLVTVAVVLAVLLAAAVGAWWWRAGLPGGAWLTGGTSEAVPVASSAAPSTSAPSSAPSSLSVSATASSPAPTTPARLPTVDLRHGNLAVTVPIGYQLVEEESTVLATGADPDLRIHLASDPLYSIDQEILFDEIERLVANDEELSDPRRGAEHFEYTEYPGDGSQVRWTTWVEGPNQLSVGCHTRVGPTTGQHAACTVATDSLTATN